MKEITEKWKPSDVWKVYAENFDELESARREWADKTLHFLDKVAELVSASDWAMKDGLKIESISPDNWYSKNNVDFQRISGKITLGSPYKFTIIIGLGTVGEHKKCHFYTYVDCRLKNGTGLRKKELEIVNQFINDKSMLVPRKRWAFYYKRIPVNDMKFSHQGAVSAVKDTLMALKNLKDFLMDAGKAN